MCWLLGERLPMGTPDQWSLVDIIRHGRELLVEIAHVDMGYDPQSGTITSVPPTLVDTGGATSTWDSQSRSGKQSRIRSGSWPSKS